MGDEISVCVYVVGMFFVFECVFSGLFIEFVYVVVCKVNLDVLLFEGVVWELDLGM